MAFIGLGKQHGEKDIQHIGGGCKGGNHLKAQQRVPGGDLHDLVAPFADLLVMPSHNSNYICLCRLL